MLFFFLALIAGSAGISTAAESKDLAACTLPADQRSSIMPLPQQVPVPTLLDPDLPPAHAEAVQKAIAIWNDFALELGREKFFHVISGPLPAKKKEFDGSSCTESTTSDPTLYIVFPSAKTWEAQGFSNSVLAATQRCLNDRQLVFQALLFPDLTQLKSKHLTVALHELGHTLGLDHSCASYGQYSDYKDCSAVSESHPYSQALMYPFTTETSPNKLMDNDRQRTCSAYGPKK